MSPNVFAHHVIVQRVDVGHALGAIEARQNVPIEPEALLALAHHLSRVALESAVREDGVVQCESLQSQMTHLAAPLGRVTGAALVDRHLVTDVSDDLRRNGSAHARVNVALVDDAGDVLGLGAFEFDLARAPE